ncbi:hypothetical protein HHI36_016348 [Cryptolaemus montrouzieri]|uniref:Uncharacterized protein n=1 Tax=Cryptolaemus montrouzieri TaxID=559131 RepID=A0ABD2NJF9_9CUCU
MDNLTNTGHPMGMLDRDQRTAKVSVYRARNHRSSFDSSSSQYGCGCQIGTSTLSPELHNIPEQQHRTQYISHSDQVRGRTSPSSFRVRKNNNRHCWVTVTRLQKTLILGFYLSVVVTFPSTLAAPSTKRSATMSTNGVEKWMAPCGNKIDYNAGHASNEIRTTDAELLTKIIDQSRRSAQKVNDFKERFAKTTFSMNWEQLFNLYKGHGSYDWLPSIPKRLGEPVSQDYLITLKLDDTLRDTYEYLQRFAVALDQIVIDEKARSNSLKTMTKDFEEVEKYAISILCEILTTMNERKVTGHPDVQRSIIPENLKNGDNTHKNVRNYMILRDYINILEYVIACFVHLQENV